ncbi:MFS family permease [Streptosporangium album]|uniref:MFS family permease n=1 Tax=Streptosporangium album TaxID=47479 RepID=A0A7W7S5X5_9ACTN|nr:MFS family permease [Streptosporangium album]
MLQALRVRDFRLLWTARLVSVFGTWLLVVAVPAHVYALTGSLLATGMTLAAEYLPVLLVGPFAGVLADRCDRRRLMIATDVIRAAVIALVLLARTPETLWIVYLALLGESLATVLFNPAAQAHTPSVVGRGPLLTGANALNALTGGVVGLMAAPLGGLLFATSGIGTVIAADIAGYLVSAAAIAFTRPRPREQQSSGPERRVLRELRDGLDFVRRSPALRGLIAAGGVYFFANAALTALLVPFGMARLGGSTQVGYLLSALGCGYLVGAPLSRWIVERVTARTAIGVGQALVGAGFLVMFTASSLPVVLAATALTGIPGVTVAVALQTWRQRATPEPFLGRVTAAFLAAEAAVTLAGSLAGPALSDTASLSVALNTASAAVVVAAAATFWLMPGLPPLDDRRPGLPRVRLFMIESLRGRRPASPGSPRRRCRACCVRPPRHLPTAPPGRPPRAIGSRPARGAPASGDDASGRSAPR